VADIKQGEQFGLDASAISDASWGLALKRITHDLRSDFIYAPHLAFVYRKAGSVVIEQVKKELKDGKYLPGLPLTIEVPKSFRIRVNVKPPRLGPPYSRPGSILHPKDRLFYQALADQAAPIIEKKLNPKRSFSHRLEGVNAVNMFKPTRVCWGELQQALLHHSSSPKVRYILKIDVANFFGSLNQHTLVNVLADAGYPSGLLSRLEALLTAYTGERSSRGILQGMYPSDLFGNFYMEPIDRLFADRGIASARYVDDMYIFLPTVSASDDLMRTLIPTLRQYDLVLNEAKSVIIPKKALNSEEPDLEALFKQAVEEISNQIDDEDFDADYGFQYEWNDEEHAEIEGDDEVEHDGLELKATEILFDAIDDYPGHEENIERFCLPLFSKAGSDYAVGHVFNAFAQRPAMTQIYAAYLSNFLDNNEIYEFLVECVDDDDLFDWQRMWVLAALLQAVPSDDVPVKKALGILQDGTAHDALRAVAAIYVGRHGDAARRKTLSAAYQNVSAYVQAAIYFSSRTWPKVERGNAKAQWGGHGTLNPMITAAMAAK